MTIRKFIINKNQFFKYNFEIYINDDIMEIDKINRLPGDICRLYLVGYLINNNYEYKTNYGITNGVLGIIHNLNGPAIINTSLNLSWSFNQGVFLLKENWFESLSSEEKKIAIWSL